MVMATELVKASQKNNWCRFCFSLKTEPTPIIPQVHRGGQDTYVPFGQQIKPSALTAEKVFTGHSLATSGYAM